MKKGLSGSAIGALGTVLFCVAVFVTFIQFSPRGPDPVGVIIAASCWILGACCYFMRWRD